MAAKTILVLCAQALLIQSISAQCIGAAYPAIAAAPFAAAPYAAGLGYAGYGAFDAAPCSSWEARGLAASNGAGLAIASASPVPPVGVSVASDNLIEGPLAVAGALPFLGTVGLEGVLPTAGAGAVSYNCGSGLVGITAEDIAAAPLAYAGPLGYASGPLGYGYGYSDGFGYGIGAPFGGCGCGAYL